MLQALLREGKLLRAIAEAIGRFHIKGMYELRRGTPARTHAKGRIPVYTAKRVQKAYEMHRTNNRKPCKVMTGYCDPSIGLSIKSVKNIGCWMPVPDTTPRPKDSTLPRQGLYQNALQHAALPAVPYLAIRASSGAKP